MKNMFENIKKYSIFIVVLGFLTWSFNPLTVFSKTTINLNDQVMNNNQKCNKCGEVKLISAFGKTSDRKSGINTICNTCINNMAYNRNKLKHNIISKIYTWQKFNSKKRGHKMPLYTLNELRGWISDRQEKFDSLYDNWIISGCDINLKPSIDRLDNTKGYSFSNVQLVTFEENKQNYYNNVRYGVETNRVKSIVGVNIKTKEIIEFYSIKDAERKLNISHSNICKVCNMEYKQIQGYIFRYKDDWDNDIINTYSCKQKGKAIMQYDLNNIFIKEYISSADAARENNTIQQNIIKVCQCERNTAGGYIWKYKKEVYNG